MKQLSLLFLVLFFCKNITSQTTIEQSKIDSLKKYKLIYISGFDVYTSTVHSGGSNAGKTVGGTARSLMVDFKIGELGSWKSVGKKGKNLYEIIKNDTLAVKELENARMHLKKKRLYSSLGAASYVALTGTALAAMWGGSKFEDEGVNALLVGGVAGVISSFVAVYACSNRVNKEMDRWAECMVKAAQVYNENLIKNLK